MSSAKGIAVWWIASTVAFQHGNPWGVEGFSAVKTASLPSLRVRGVVSMSRMYMATVQKENSMSALDEKILFGDADTTLKKHAGVQKGEHASSNMNILPPENPLDYSASNPLINKLKNMRESLDSYPQVWRELAAHIPHHQALLDYHLCDEVVQLTFEEVDVALRRSAAAFAALGVGKGKNVALLGENSARWLLADQGIQLAGGVTAVRGADAPLDELRYIYEHSDSAGIAVLQGPRLLRNLMADAAKKKLGSKLGLSNASHGEVTTIVLLHREKFSAEDIVEMAQEAGVEVFVLDDLIKATEPLEKIQQLTKDDLSTIVYTSGTTGRPKGVMLTHGNLLHQIFHRLQPSKPFEDAEPVPGDVMVSILPIWHITERTFELYVVTRGCTIVYSSIRTFRNDLAKHKPQWMVLVPRVLEKVAKGVQDKFAAKGAATLALVKLFTAVGKTRATHKKIAAGLVAGAKLPGAIARVRSGAIAAALSPLNAVGDKLVWSKVRDGFGGRIQTIIAGGSALSGALEDFYEICGINIAVAYGLTECSPVIAFRRVDKNLVTAGCVGRPAHLTEFRVVDPASEGEGASLTTERPSLPVGEPGLVVARGPQVMKGYYKNPEATAKAVDRYGWFDTGDLGKINPATGELILTGRCKDTIVLSNGENIEPSPIEGAILTESPLVEQVVLIGQDGKSLRAIAVLNPVELVGAGFVGREKGEVLQKENERLNDPKCTPEECAAASEVLRAASAELRGNSAVVTAVMDDIKRATSSFRAWEQVADVLVTLEPFAMANGQLTQSYKVKRDAVVSRYSDELS